MQFKYVLLCIFVGLLCWGFAQPGYTGAKIKIVTTLPDLKDIAEQVGGDQVEVFAIAKGYQDPHFVDAKPSFVLQLKQANLFIQVGLDLEVGWVPPLLQTARNKDVYFGGPGYLDSSLGVELLEIPKGDPGQLRAQGDIHVYGNPHFWLDPENGKILAGNVARKLMSLYPASAAYFQSRYELFSVRMDSALQDWQMRMAPFKGKKIIAYHNSWPYFEKRFGLKIVAFIEPKPGISPSPSHLVSVIAKAKEENIKVIIISPYFDDKPAQSIARRTGAHVIQIAPSVGAFKEIVTYFDLFDYNINMLIEAFKKDI